MRYVRQFSIRSLLGISFWLLVLLPALLIAWWMLQRTDAVVDELADRTLRDAASRGQAEVQTHLLQAYRTLDGFMPENKNAQTPQALAWVSDPALFAPMAFALTRSMPDLRFVYFGSASGGVHGVENTPEGFRFGDRIAVDNGFRMLSARNARSPIKGVTLEGESPDPRSRAWYGDALQARSRRFSPISVYPDNKQLAVTLSQPVYDAAGADAGVLGADLSLQPLSALLRAQRISSHAVAFLVDEQGVLVASTAPEAPAVERGGLWVARSAKDSTNALVRNSFIALERQWQSAPDTRQTAAEKLQRMALSDDPVLLMYSRAGSAQGLPWTLVVAAPESDFSKDANNALKLLLAGLGSLVLLGALVTSFGTRHLERVFRYLARSIDQLRNGAIPPLSQKTAVGELRQLSRNLQDCARQINGGSFDAFPEVEDEALSEPAPTLPDGQAGDDLNAQLFATTLELAAHRDRAMAATRSKDAFLAVISHELRTPLNGVIGMSSLLSNTPLGPEQRDYLDSLCVSSSQLQAVVDEILDYSRTESGELVLQIAPLNVRTVVEEACDQAARSAFAKGLKLTVDVPGRIARPGDGVSVPWIIEGDAARLGQVLGQLVFNAVKFTDSGNVSVQVRPLEPPAGIGLPMLEARVTDTGLGIAPERLDEVFTAFTQLDSSISRKHGGTGLGLATCKRLVELMGGRMGVESEQATGSTFWFTTLAPWATPDTLQSHVDDELPGLPEKALPDDSHKGSILVVDDNLINLKVACAMLIKFGYSVLTAGGGQEAIGIISDAALRGEMPAAILMDVHMPVVDGVQAAQAIRAMHGALAPPIIALTAGASDPDRQRCLDAGMVEYLTKPLLISDLARVLERWAQMEVVHWAQGAERPLASLGNFFSPALSATEAQGFERFSEADLSMPTGLVDFDRLNDFRKFDDDQLSVTREVIGLLFSEVPVRIAAIETAIARSDVKGLGRAAHSLRGAAASVGAVTVQHLCSVLERGTLDAQSVAADAPACLVALRLAWTRTQPLLENWR